MILQLQSFERMHVIMLGGFVKHCLQEEDW